MNAYLQNSIWIVLVILSASSCYYEDIPRQPDPSICLGTDLNISATAQSTSGCGKTDGSISALATGGSGNYTFSKDGGKTKQTSGSFIGLGGGTYLIIVFDGSQCTDSTEVTVTNTGSNFQASVKSISPDTECLSDNGMVELMATGNTGTVSFKIGTTTNSTGIFTGLAGGTYSASVSDASCSINVPAAGHFVQRDAPLEVFEIIDNWLKLQNKFKIVKQ